MCYSIIKEKPLQEVYICITEALSRAKLSLDDSKGWAETIEVHLDDPEYQYAFGSIQYCKACKSHASYLELRFKKKHLKYVGMFQELDTIKDNPYRNDAKSENPEAVRFHFYTMDNSVRNFVTTLGKILTTGLVKN